MMDLVDPSMYMVDVAPAWNSHPRRRAPAQDKDLALALARVAELEQEAEESAEAQRQLQAKHSVLLEVLGERVERIQQLEGDMHDMNLSFQHNLAKMEEQLRAARLALETAGIVHPSLAGLLTTTTVPQALVPSAAGEGASQGEACARDPPAPSSPPPQARPQRS